MNEKSKILIIEDDTDLVAALKILLETKDYQVITAYDPEEGSKKLSQERPDLIILDVMFGSKGESMGFDFAQKIRYEKQSADIPILMLTAINAEKPFFSFSPDTDGEYLPVDSFIDKPVQIEELYKKVEELLKQKTSKWSNWPDKKK
ncbi:MAG TPA: response regulator [Bacteroidales bacterium]|nr:response regulator [Bacteroidales bacterium]